MFYYWYICLYIIIKIYYYIVYNMLSFTKGRNIAQFIKGRFKGKKIFLNGENDFSNKNISELDIAQSKKFALIPPQYFKDKKINRMDRQVLKRAVDNDLRISQLDPHLQEDYEDIIKLIDKKLKTEIDFTDVANVNLFPKSLKMEY